MKTPWSVYRLSDGRLTGRTVTCALSQLAAHTPDGCGLIEGVHDHLSQQVDQTDPNTPTVVDYRPPTPADTELAAYAWDNSTKRYVATPTLLANKQARVAPLRFAIEAAEAAQARPLRELMLARAADLLPDQATLDALQAIEDKVAPLRQTIADIMAAASQQALDAIT